MKCPKCNSEILKEYVNIQTDIAQCINCNNIFRISDSIREFDDGFNIRDTPNGTWVKHDFDSIIIGATTRSPYAFFIVPFMVVWSGFSIGGIYGSQIINGEFNPSMSLFGIPFIIGSIIFWGVALMTIWGKVELTMDKNGGKVFTGLGKLGLTKNFIWNDIYAIKEIQSNYNYAGNTGGKILLEGKSRIAFGFGVKESRRYYLFKALQKTYFNMKMNKKL